MNKQLILLKEVLLPFTDRVLASMKNSSVKTKCKKNMNLFKFNFFSKQPLIATQIIALQILRHVHFWQHLIGLVTACFRINQETIGGLPIKKKDLPHY